MKGKQICETETQAIYRYMEDQSRGITYETNKAKHKLRFMDNDLRTHTEAYIRCQISACVGLFENPNPENSKHRNKTELKIINLTS